jgi:cystathionine beta-synthase
MRNVIGLMKEHGISQIPVMDRGRLSGLVSEIDLLNYLLQNPGSMDVPVDELVEADYATVTPQTKIKLLKTIFNDAKLVCVLERDDLVGVISKIDLIEYLASKRA